MADGTVRGEFTLTSEAALHGLRAIRDTGREADAALESLGNRLDALGRKTARPRIDLTGIEAANAKLSELEARLDRINRGRYSPHVGISGNITGLGGGGGGYGPQGLVAGGGGRPVFGSLGGLGGSLPWWAMAAPFAPTLIGGAGALLGSAGSAALGAGALGLGGAGMLGVGGGLTAAIAKPAVAALGNITKAQDAYTKAVQEFGRQSAQATTAARNYNQALAGNPMAAGAARQLGLARGEFGRATSTARANVYSGISGTLYNARRAIPTVGYAATAATGASAGAATAFSGFLAQPAEQAMLMRLSGAFAQNLPIAERSLENIATMFGHLAVDALPFFHEANVWVENWTAGLARSSSNQVAVQGRMQTMVNSAHDWARLMDAGYHVIRDIFSAGRPAGDSMVMDLTTTLNTWDQWIRNNPDKVRRFFSDAEQGTGRIASVIGNLGKDLWDVFRALDPILKRAEQFLGFASSLGGGSLLTGGLALYAGYRGARGALGGGGPGAGGVLGSMLLGSPVPMVRSAAGGAGGASAAALARASNYEVAAGRSASGAILLGGATEGPDAVLARRAAAAADATALTRLRSLATATPAIGRAADILGGAGTAIAGAARTVVPVMAGFAALQGITAGAGAGGSLMHGLNVGVSTALSGLTLGAVKPSTIEQIYGGAPTGSDSRLAPVSRQLAAQANAVRTPQDLQALQRSVGTIQIGAEMSPAAAAALRRQIQQALQVGASNAGATASNTWESAFTRGLQRGVGPEHAVSQMLGGMQSQISGLGRKGSVAFARDTAQWVSQMEADNPKLQRPLERLMRGIVDDINRMNKDTGDSFKQLQDKVFYFNGQILTGSQNTWGKIHDALVDPSQRAQEKLSGIWGQIQQQAINSLQSMGFTHSQARTIVTQSASGKASQQNMAAVSVAQRQNIAKAAPGQQITPLGTPAGRATGGVIPGDGLLDTVNFGGAKVAPGEAWVANRHTMNALSSATLEKFGKTAWEMIRDEGRPHSQPMRFASGGFLSNLAGVISGAGNAISTPTARGSGGNWVSRSHPELHPGIAQAVQDVLAHFPLTITSTNAGGHASGSYHYLGEAADISGPSATMYSAANWIKSSGLARSLTEGIHNPNLSVKFGNAVSPGFWGASTWAQHANHIHMAVAGALGAVGGGGGATLGMAPQISLNAPRSGLRGIPGAMADRASALYTAGLQATINNRIGAAGGISGAGWSGGGSNTANQQLGHRMMLAAGWGEDQWPSLQALWNQESGWSSTVTNASSGAYGIPQALGHGHPYNLGDAPAQIAWGLNYIRGRYGSPAAAEAHERSHNWYQRGGRVNWAGWNAKGGSFVTNGPTMFGAGERNKEQVTVTPLGQGPGRQIHVHLENVHLHPGNPDELEAFAEDIAGRIHDALDRTAGGASDSELAGVA